MTQTYPTRFERLNTIQNIEDYCTDRQLEVLRVIEKTGGVRSAADYLGVNERSVRSSLEQIERKAGQKADYGSYDLKYPVAPGMTSKGTSILYDENDNPLKTWNKTGREGLEPADAFKLDNGQIVRTATLYDASGKVTQQWVTEKADEAKRQEAFQAVIDALKDELPRAEVVEPPKDWQDNLMVAYPVGDHHFGMYAWHEETDADYNIDIAEKLLYGAMSYLVDTSPACEVALIPILGDFLHYDSMESVTPASRNQLDSDTRFPAVVKAAIKAVRFLVHEALKKHNSVHLIIEIGNHDTASSIWLMQAMDAFYDDDPRVTVDTSPKHFHYFSFGKVLIATHHGHTVKTKDLPLLLATDMPKEWGESKFRMWWTGHIHHETKTEFAGATVESFKVLASQDAWHHKQGYRALPDMKSIVLHKEFGEVDRHNATPAMLLGNN